MFPFMQNSKLKQLEKTDCLGPLIAVTERIVLQDKNGTENSPSDLSENYKKYVYSKDAR